MTKQERFLLKKLAGAYAFITALRARAIDRVDVEFIKTTAGIEKAVKEMDEAYPRLFSRYIKLAHEKADNEQTKSKERQTEEAAPKRKAKRKSEGQTSLPRSSR